MKVGKWILAFAACIGLLGCDLMGYTPQRDAPNDPAAPVAAPVIDPVGGTVALGQTVRITCATAGAAISFTVNGTSAVVTDLDPVYQGPVSLSTGGSTTIRARAYKSGRTASDTVAVEFTVSADIVAMPQFSPASGAVPAGQEITITCATGGADIRYTMDGNDPSDASTLYSDASKPAITAAVTLKAMAYKSGMSASSIATTSYTLTTSPTVLTPSFTPPTGPIPVGGTVQILCATPGASIYFTTDGTTEPTESSTAYNDAARPAITQNTTLKAKAFKTGMDPSGTATANYSITVATPTFNPAPGVLAFGASIQILCDTASASIYFTTDGTTEPTQSSTLYNDAARPILAASTTFKAKAFKTGMDPSPTTTASYTAAYTAPTAPALALPTDGIASVDPTSVGFQWAASTDPDPGDSLTYDVYVDTANPPTNRRTSSPIAGTTFPLAGLSNSVTYYWRVVAYDLHGFSTPSDVRSFTTRAVTVVTSGSYILTPTVWTGTVRTNLEGGVHGGIAYSVTSSGGTLRAAGTYYDGAKYVPCTWAKGGSTWTRTDLDFVAGAGIYNYAYAIAVDGSTVYAAGHCNSTGAYKGRCWSGSTGTALAPTSTGSCTISYAYGIAVSGGTAYVSGYSEGSSVNYPCYWTVTGGVATVHDLAQGASTNGKAYGMAFSGSDWYIVGVVDGYACYWKNGTRFPLYQSNGVTPYAGQASAVAASGSKVCMAGYNVATGGYLWTIEGGTTTAQPLTQPAGTWVATTVGMSMAIGSDGTPYVPGSLVDTAANPDNYTVWYWAGASTPVAVDADNSNPNTYAFGLTLIP